MLVFVRGRFQEISIAVLPMGLKPRHVEKFRECRLTDVREGELTEKKKCAKHKTGFVQILESPGILLFRIPGPGKRHRSWKVLELYTSGSGIVSYGLSSR